MEENVSPICFLCRKGENLQKFSENTLQKCKSSLAIRKTANIQYSEVELPESLDDLSIGYHSRPCYKTFTSINSKYVSRSSK